MAKNSKISQLILTLFFLSGFCGLLYEITWSRLIGLTLGNSTEAITATVAAFMAGMAIGGYAGGKVADRRINSLWLYGILEGLAGLYALALPFLLRLARPLLSSLYQNAQAGQSTMILARFAVCCAVLLVPAALFGAMLPLLSRFLIRQPDQFGNLIGKLYGLNLFGAALGALVSGLWLIPHLGVSKTIYLAALIEFLICGWVLILSGKEGHDAVTSASAPAQTDGIDLPFRDSSPLSSPLILLAMALSGASALVYEITWTRAIIMIIGSTVYAFSLMLTAVIAGLALGSMCAARLIDRRKDLVLIFGLLEIGVGGATFGLAPFFEKLTLVVIPMFNLFGNNFAALQAIELSGLFFLMLLPSLLLGMIFPLMSTMYVRGTDRPGGGVGATLMANSLGAVAGTVASGLFLIPAIGIQKTMLAASMVNVFLGSSALLFSPSLSGIKKAAAFPLAFGCGLLFFITQPEWNKALISGAPYVYGRVYAGLSRQGSGQSVKEIVLNQADLLFYQEDAQTTVSVKKDKGEQLFLQLNGKTDASSREDNCTQRLLAHIPLLLHPDPQQVMVLGLGSGVTLGAAEKYSTVKHLDCIEISPAVIRAAACFNEVNGRSLDDPRLRIIVGDGREHLALTDQKYDVIISQPCSPWIAGMSGLLTREFFQLCRERLNGTGLCCIWLQTCNLDMASSQSVVKAFGEVFPSLSIWEARPGIDYLLIGGTGEIKLDYQLVQRKMAGESLHRELKTVGLPRPDDLLARFVMSKEGAARYVQGACAHTDDTTWLEFHAPKLLYQETINEHLQALNALRGLDFASLLTAPAAEAGSLKDTLPKAFEAQKHYALAEMDLLRNKQEEGARKIKEAYLLDPADARIRERYYRLLLNAASNCSLKGMHEVAAQILQSAIRVNPDGFEGYLNLGLACFHTGQVQAAIQQFRLALLIQPDNEQAHLNLGACYLRAGNLEDSIQANLTALRIKPGLVNAHFNLGIAYMRSNRVAQAIAEYQEAIKYQPNYAEAHLNLGIAYQTSGAWDQAAREYEESLRLRPDLPNARQLLDQVQAVLRQGS
ncbi:MAG: fused MFS/spermidine synthase [bacterium]